MSQNASAVIVPFPNRNRASVTACAVPVRPPVRAASDLSDKPGEAVFTARFGIGSLCVLNVVGCRAFGIVSGVNFSARTVTYNVITVDGVHAKNVSSDMVRRLTRDEETRLTFDHVDFLWSRLKTD